MHVNGGSLYKTYDTPRKSTLVVKNDGIEYVSSLKNENTTHEDLSLQRIFSKLNRGEELTEAEMNYVKLHDKALYADLSILYNIRDEIMQTLENLSFEEATLFIKREKEELGKNLSAAYKEEKGKEKDIQLLEWYYGLLDKTWYRYLKKREHTMNQKVLGKKA